MKHRIEFEKIKRTDVPFWHPVAQPVVHPKESQWEEALVFLLSDPEAAIRIREPNERLRLRKKSTLQTIAKNRGFHVKVLNQTPFIYAWRTDEPRYWKPSPSHEQKI